MSEELIFEEPTSSIHRKDIVFTIDTNGCWICTSHHKDKDGYPRAVRNGKKQHLSRYIYSISNNNINIDGMQIRHTCDQPRCINPNHLVIGTNDDNVCDRQDRNRQAKGENNGWSKLTNDQAKDIKYNHADKSTSELASMYGVGYDCIRQIRIGKNWSWI